MPIRRGIRNRAPARKPGRWDKEVGSPGRPRWRGKGWLYYVPSDVCCISWVAVQVMKRLLAASDIRCLGTNEWRTEKEGNAEPQFRSHVGWFKGYPLRSSQSTHAVDREMILQETCACIIGYWIRIRKRATRQVVEQLYAIFFISISAT